MLYTDKVMDHFKAPKYMGEIKDADAIGKVGNPTCLPTGTLIHGNDSLKIINKAPTGSRVLGHDGKYNKIIQKTSKKINGKLLEIKNKLGKTQLTEDHMVYAVKLPKTWGFSFAKNKKKFPVGWYHANELEKGDLVAYPIMAEQEDKTHLEFKQERKRLDFKSKNIPSKIQISSGFLRLSGYYLAEGSLRDITSKTYASFTFNIKEMDLVEDVVSIVKEIFDLDAKVKTHPEHNTAVVEVHNVWFTRLFKSLFSIGSDKKSIPHELMLLPPKKQESLLYGLWKGDGLFNTKKPRAGYTTISRVLSQQIKTLLLRQKIIPSIYKESAKNVDGVNHKESFRIHIGDRSSLNKLASILKIEFSSKKSSSVNSWFKEGHLYMPITAIDSFDYHGMVHNLEVENSHSYLTESLAVHNCGDVMWVYIKVKDDKIDDIRVKTFGCVAAIATSDVVCELALGKSLDEASKIGKDEIIKELGELPPQKIHCSLLAHEALADAIEKYKKGIKD